MLNQNAPQKKKHVRGNQVTFMTKHKELIERSRNRKEDDRTLYDRQRIYNLSLLQKFKRDYYENLNLRK